MQFVSPDYSTIQAAILDQAAGEVNRQNAFSQPLFLRCRFPGAPAPAVNGDSQVHACRRKNQVMRQYPIPVADIQGREKGGKSGGQVEIGKEIVKKLRKPDSAACQEPGIARHFLCDAEIDILLLDFGQHSGELLAEHPCRCPS
jgi:hypothetical protein